MPQPRLPLRLLAAVAILLGGSPQAAFAAGIDFVYVGDMSNSATVPTVAEGGTLVFRNDDDVRRIPHTVTGCTARRSSYTADYDPEIGAYDGIGFVLSDAYNHFGGRSTVSSSIASENEHYGFYLYHPGPTVLKGNSALSNGDDGVYVYEAYGSYGPVWGSNDIARDNSGYGLYSDYAVIGTGNRISGNDEDDWGCPGWTCTVSR